MWLRDLRSVRVSRQLPCAEVFLIAIPEVFSVFTFQNPVGSQPWTVRTDHSPGDLGWDPLGLKPTNPAELAEMQTKELNNGRLAMIAIAGMIVSCAGVRAVFRVRVILCKLQVVLLDVRELPKNAL